ncbi:RidA family protein [Ilumatobacter sp.]|uniref:RidA family protein n=1 Tax=Ilumatobacter sp. TaxID=1967498 RepID=UPI003B520B82
MSTPLGPYTPVVRSGDLVFVSGQGGLLDGSVVDGGVAAETAQAMTNLRDLLAEVGASLDDVVKTTCFLTDMENYAKFNREYSAAFGDHRPARSCVAVRSLPAGFLVEIEAIAHLAGGD